MARLETVPETTPPHELTEIIERDVVPKLGESDGNRVRVDNYREENP